MGGNLSWLNQPLQTWFREAHLRPFPLPPALDCRGCSRSQKASEAKEALRWRQYKCCTFQPFVANFLLGAELEVRALPASKQVVISPLGLCPTPEYRAQFFATGERERGADLKCAFFDERMSACTAWTNRPSECSVYYCESSAFHRNRSNDLFEWEIAVAQMACLQFGYDLKELDSLMAWMDWDDSDNLRERWKHYAGREREFFTKTWQWAKTLTGREIHSWLSPDVQQRFDSWIRFA